jgi:hypothetical protein
VKAFSISYAGGDQQRSQQESLRQVTPTQFHVQNFKESNYVIGCGATQVAGHNLLGVLNQICRRGYIEKGNGAAGNVDRAPF